MSNETTVSPRAAFSVERKALAQALEHFPKHILAASPEVPVLQCVKLEAHADGRLTITGTDLEVSATVSVPCDCDAPGSITLAPAALIDLARAKGKAPIRIERVGERVTASSDGAQCAVRADLNVYPAKRYADAADSVAFEIDAEQLRTDLLRLLPFVHANSKRPNPVIEGVSLERASDGPDGDALAFVATNGATLVRIFRPLPDGAQPLERVMMPLRAAKALARLLKDRTGPAIVTIDSASLAVDANGLSFRSDRSPVIFPAWRQVVTRALGDDGLQRLAFPELEPRLRAADLAVLEKVAGGPLASVETGASGALCTFDGAPEMLALCYLGETATRYTYDQGVSVALDDDTSAKLRTDSAGVLEISAAAMARLVGDPADFPRRDIPEITIWRGRILAPGWCLPVARTRREKAESARTTGLAAFSADPRGVVASLQPLWTGKGEPGPMFADELTQSDAPAAVRPEAERSPVEPGAATVPVSEPVEMEETAPADPAPDAEPALLARIAALEAAVAVLTGGAAPAPQAAPAGPSREVRLRIAHRYLAFRRTREALRLAYATEQDLRRETAVALDAMTRRAERAEAQVSEIAMSGRARGDRLARVATRQRRSLRRAQDDLRGAQAETRAISRSLADARAAMSRRGNEAGSAGRILETARQGKN